MKAEKVAHVKQSRQTRRHHCHWPHCKAQVAPAKWGCMKHWMKLPKFLREQIWDAYTPGQEESGKPGAYYITVARDVQAWIASREENEIGRMLS